MWYHGRPVRSRVFDLRFAGGKAANDQEGPGFYFTTDLDEARMYAHPSGVVLSANLAARRWVSTVPSPGWRPNPALVERLMRASPCYRDVLTDWDESPSRAHAEALRSMLRYGGDSEHAVFQSVWADFYLRCGESPAYLQALTRLGYGGVQVSHPAGPYVAARVHAIIFDPAVIRDVRVVEDLGSGPVEGLSFGGFFPASRRG